MALAIGQIVHYVVEFIDSGHHVGKDVPAIVVRIPSEENDTADLAVLVPGGTLTENGKIVWKQNVSGADPAILGEPGVTGTFHEADIPHPLPKKVKGEDRPERSEEGIASLGSAGPVDPRVVTPEIPERPVVETPPTTTKAKVHESSHESSHEPSSTPKPELKRHDDPSSVKVVGLDVSSKEPFDVKLTPARSTSEGDDGSKK